MIPTWRENLQSLHIQRKNYLKSLRYLQEQASKVSKISISMFSEIEDIKSRLRDVEAQILDIQAQYKGELDQDSSTPKLLEPAVYGKEETKEDKGEGPLLKSETVGPDSKLSVVSRRDDFRSFPLVVLVLGVSVLFVILVVGGWLLLSSKSENQLSATQTQENSEATASTNSPQSHLLEIVIYPDYYHIGDVIIKQFHMPSPQPNPFRTRFEVLQQGVSYSLFITAVHVDPNAQQSPTTIYLNDHFVAYLNSYFQEESLSPETVAIAVDPSFITKGINEIKIEEKPTTLEYQSPNLDDFEFWELTLQIETK